MSPMRNPEARPPTLSENISHRTGVSPARCYQCGKCSAGCPLAVDMDIPPSRLMRLLQCSYIVPDDRILRSKTIWMCLSCETCFVRCPMEIDIPAIMDALRHESLARGMVNPKGRKILSFHRAFLDSLQYTGRMYEMGVIADYKVRTASVWQDLLMAPVMFFKGKLHLLPERIRQRRLMARIFKRTLREKRS